MPDHSSSRQRFSLPALWRKYRRDLLLALVIIAGLHFIQTRHVPDGDAPAFAAPRAGGGTVELEQWLAAQDGSAAAIYFWADWCPVCTAQQGSISALKADWPILSVAMQSGDADAVARSLADRGLDWRSAVDADGSIAARYGVHGVPALVVVDRQGHIRAASIGYTPAWAMRLRLWWATLRSHLAA